MSHQEFDIIFRGDIVLGQQLAEVKLRLQQLFKTDAAKVESLFSGRPVPLKRGLDHASAQKYKAALLQAGAQVDIVASSVAATPATPMPLADKPNPVSARVEPMAPVINTSVSPAINTTVSPVITTSVSPAINPANWSVAAVGSDILAPAERAHSEPKAIDISALSLRPEGGNILDDSEQPAVIVAQVNIPNFNLAAVGEDLVRADEKVSLPLAEITLENWSLAETGADLISASEKPQVDIPVIHIPELGLAPVGADLGQLKRPVEAVVPDISAIRLADGA